MNPSVEECPKTWSTPVIERFGSVEELTRMGCTAVGKTCPGGPDVYDRAPEDSVFCSP